MGNRLRTTYYTRKVALVNPVCTTIPGTCDAEWQNGGVIVYRALLDNAVLYPNPYITITPQGYTKHYFSGQERIASATGGGRWDVTPDHLNNREADIIDDYWGHYTSNNPFEEVSGGKTDNANLAGNTPSVLQYDCAPSQLFRLGLKWEDDMLSSCINTYLQYSGSETTYFTHSDHLGSASWITDPHGYPIQYIHYAPYGELLADQKPTGSTYGERYKFTGKERDAESGYDYFGARFLAQQLGIWLSVDPLADKYIYATPYMYCNGNPIKYVDPNGEWVHVVVGAGIGAIVCAGIALNSGKSWQDVGTAALGGAVAGAITTATGGFGGSSVALSTLFGAGGGMLGGAAGNLTEQGVKIATGSQSSVDVEEVGSATFAGAVAGAIGGLVKGLITKGAAASKQIIERKYQSQSTKQIYRKEVTTDLKSLGKKASFRSVNKIATERMENSQKVDEMMIKGTEKFLNGINQVTTTNIENDIKD